MLRRYIYLQPGTFFKIQIHVSNWLLGITTWMSNQHLKVSMSKLSSLSPPPNLTPNLLVPVFLISVSDSSIIWDAQNKNLKVIFDSFFCHTSYIQCVNKSNRQNIFRIWSFLTTPTIIILVKVTIISHFDYCHRLLTCLLLPPYPHHSTPTQGQNELLQCKSYQIILHIPLLCSESSNGFPSHSQ